MSERPIAYRRWVRKKVQASEAAAPAAPAAAAKRTDSTQSEVLNTSNSGKLAVVLLDGDEGPERLKKTKFDQTGSGNSSMGSHPVNNSESSVVDRGLTDSNPGVKPSGKSLIIEDDDDDEIVDPDERWEPPGAGALTTYVKPQQEWDWVVVSQRQGETVKALHAAEEVLVVKPLQTAVPETYGGEFVVEDDGGDACESDDELFEDCAFNTEPDIETDPRTLVCETLEKHEKIRVKFMHEAENPRRPGDCASKAAKYMNGKNAWINRGKRIGRVPGVEVGDCFYFRIALCLIGLHQQTQAGISCMGGELNKTGELLAISLVLSGGYEDDKDDGEMLIYTGQGGNNNRSKRQQEDQKLERGNLGLANSCKHDTSVRVIRGYADPASPSGRIYSYDGLYKVTRCWSETGLSGFKVYRYRLEREPGQRERGSKIVKFSGKLKAKKASREGVVCEDLSFGIERVSICVVNDVDPPALPPSFKYITKVIPPIGFDTPPVPPGCRCIGACVPSSCSCIEKNNGQLPYNTDGTLLDWQPIVIECGPHCRCPPTCYNRVSQKPQTKKLEVFKTPNRGWGVRCWESIPFGSFICEYVGEMIDNDEAERRVGNDEYIFDIDCVNGNRSRGVDISSFFESKPQGGELCLRVEEGVYSIDAAVCGNVSRFINHSCDPNLWVQCVFYDHYDMKTPHIMMFAMKHIRPFEELSYDYGYRVGSVKDSQGKVKKKPCFCGSRKCTRRLY